MDRAEGGAGGGVSPPPPPPPLFHRQKINKTKINKNNGAKLAPTPPPS